MKKTGKAILSLMLTLIMLVGMFPSLPIAVKAEEVQCYRIQVVDLKYSDKMTLVQSTTLPYSTTARAILELQNYFSSDANSVRDEGGDDILTISGTNITINSYGQKTISITFGATTRSFKIIVERLINSTVTGYTGTYDGQAHGISVNVTVPSNGATVKYGTTSGEYNLTSSPTYTNAGTYTVYYQITASNYLTEAGSGIVIINKNNPDYTVPSGLTATYGQTLANVALPLASNGSWSWDDSSANVGNVGTKTFKATFTPTDTVNYNTISDVDVTVTVAKANPAYTVPTGLTATYGDMLSSVALPSGWSWDDSSADVGNAGTNTFKATFTPDDTEHYNTVSNVDLTVTVGKRPGEEAVISDGVITYTSDKISIEGVEGQEYIIVPKGTEISESDWKDAVLPDSQDSNRVIFENLASAEEYEVYTRMAETENTTAGPEKKIDVYTTPSGIEINYDSTLVGASATVKTTPEAAYEIKYKWYQDEITVDDEGNEQHTLTEIPGAEDSEYTFRAEDVDKYITVKIYNGDSEIGKATTLTPVVLNAKVVFDSMGGSEVDSQTGLAYQDKLTKPSDPIRKGYNLEGWYLEKEYKTAWDFENDTVNHAEMTLYAKWTPIDYEITSVAGLTGSGKDQWKKGSTDAFVITVKLTGDYDNSFEHFIGVKLDGKELERDVDYTAEKGSTIVTLLPETLEKLEVGEHTATVVFDNYEVNTTFNVLEEKSGKPASMQTGDSNNIMLWIVLTICSAAVAIALICIRRKRGYKYLKTI